MFRVALLVLFGDPRLALALRVLAALGRLCPCQPTDDLCDRLHRETAAAVAIVASEQRAPEATAALLVGLAVHESCARVEHQILGWRPDGSPILGPAVTVFQLEVPARERGALLADSVAAARLALRAAGGCGGSLRGYATGSCHGGGERGARVAAELRASVLLAWWALAQ